MVNSPASSTADKLAKYQETSFVKSFPPPLEEGLREVAIKMPKRFNFPRQKETRRYLRKNETEGEKILWSKLRNRQMLGYKFRRQHGIDHYIVDFYCPEKRLAIEVDGVTHSSPEERDYDRERENLIKTYGIKFVRVTNADVYKNLDGVLIFIGEELQKIITSYYEKNDNGS